MSIFRLALITFWMAALAACGVNYSQAPATAPTPVPPAASGSPATVSIPAGAAVLGSQAFPPNPLTVDAGTTVTWVNTDAVAHTSSSDAPGWNSGVIAPGSQFSVPFDTAGTFHYHCQIHPGMIGTVVVR